MGKCFEIMRANVYRRICIEHGWEPPENGEGWMVMPKRGTLHALVDLKRHPKFDDGKPVPFPVWLRVK